MSDIQISPLISDAPAKDALKSLQLFRTYYAEYYGEQFADLSFQLRRNGTLAANALCYKIGTKLCWPSDGIRIDDLSAEEARETTIINGIIDHIESLAKIHSCSCVIKDRLIDGAVSPLGAALLDAGYRSQIVFEMLIPFENFDEASYFSSIRKRYKSHINWGRKNLEIKIIDRDHLSSADFLSYKDFHLKIAGRKTRSDESWNIQYEMIEQGLGELVLGYYQGQLVAGSLFADQYDTSMYFTGVYERSLFEFGLSHYLMYYGICRSAARGGTDFFSLGNFATDIADPKWYNIQSFKKGFAQDFVPTLLWSKDRNEAEEQHE